MVIVGAVCLLCAALPAVVYVWNQRHFRPPPGAKEDPSPRPAVSVLIPARNEEGNIAACVTSVLASRGVELEVIVLDDHSTDRTAAVVAELAAKDSRVRLQAAPPLPEGWCGKQHACYTLAGLARYPILTFLDADVRLRPDGLAGMVRFLRDSQAHLVSGFPRQRTVTFLEKLVIPLIHWVLLGFLPLAWMRRKPWPGLGAGCGQWFMTDRASYFAVGGHGHPQVRSSRHDGLTLPRAYRRAGYRTDLCDASAWAECRMYRSSRELWFGLAKNAREGMASNGQIGFWTFVLLAGQVLPPVVLAAELFSWGIGQCGIGTGSAAGAWVAGGAIDPLGVGMLVAAAGLAWGVRTHLAWRLGQSWLGVVLHPLAIVVLLAIQWYALVCALRGRPVAWKGR